MDVNTEWETIPKEVRSMLFSLLGSKKLSVSWWNSMNYAFDLASPKNVYKEDQDKVLKYLYQFCYML